jgi:nucleoprotein TPR
VSAQQAKASELRKKVTTLEQTVQSTNSAAASAKFRESSLQREIELLKKNNEWFENERKLKAEEHTAFRKEKNARIAELSRSSEQYIAEIEALKRSETSLKHRIEEMSNKYDDALQEIQKLRDEKSAEAEAFRVDLETANRLTELQRASFENAQQRAQQLQESYDELQEQAANEIGMIRAQAAADHEEQEAAARKIAQLEADITQLQSELEQENARPRTPQPPTNGTPQGTPLRPSTPAGVFSPTVSSRFKTPTHTQMFSEYKRIEKELAREKQMNEELQSSMDDMLARLEESKPELDEVRAENAKLQNEIVDISSDMEASNKERDEAVRTARGYHGQLEARVKEVESLQQQLRDLSSQVRRLAVEIELRERGGTITDQEWAAIQEQAEKDSHAEMEGLSETQRIVNERLIAFKNVSELQQQNQNQLTTIRNLVGQLESQEVKDRQQKMVDMEEELKAAREKMAGFQDEIKTMVAQSKSFVKERDMFRNMLTRKGQLGDVTDFSRSLPMPQSASPGQGDSDLAKVIKELQGQFDSYRRETVVDQSSLKSQVDDLSKRNSELQTQASRLQGQLSAASQRAEMLQSNYNMLKTENSELQKRSYAAMENATRQEMKVQQAAEDLIETKGLVDSLQRESSNLKAEKDLWKNVEKRLIEDTENLRNERSRLDQLNSSLQGMLNEREHADSESRRRLQTQLEALEGELQSTKRKLNDEQEDSRKATLHREYEKEQNQKRIDDLMSSLSSLREESAGVKASRDHLQARVEELTVELRAAEERLEVYTKPAAQSSNESTEEETASREQELTLEITELKRELEHKKSEVDRINEQIEVYKNISQSAEERLQELGDTNDQYREETEASLAEKDAKIQDLQQRIEDITSELDSTNTELSKLRDDQSEVDRRLQEQKSGFEAEIERLKEQEERATEQAQFNLEASKAQAQIATEAQQNYETELVKRISCDWRWSTSRLRPRRPVPACSRRRKAGPSSRIVTSRSLPTTRSDARKS